MSSSESSESLENEISDNENGERAAIRDELSSMTFEEIMKLKDELGSKVYKDAVLGETEFDEQPSSSKEVNFKRLNKNRPREMSSKRQVPFLGSDLRTQTKAKETVRDPRFDEKCGEYNTKHFKENYKFIAEVRQKEIAQLRKKAKRIENPEERKQIKKAMQTLINKNLEDQKWHDKQSKLKAEQEEIQNARKEGRQPHFATKKERRAKELVTQFEALQKTGGLAKHLEKRRKKNAAKDRKKFSFD